MKIFSENIGKYHNQLTNLNTVLKRFSLARLIIFVVSVTVLFILVNKRHFLPFIFGFPAFIIGFALVIKHHNKVAYKRKHTSFLKNINEQELLLGECKLKSFDTGKEFINPLHSYTSDLDIFGQHSIFQSLNRTTTESGKILLAKWLSKPAENNEITKRQNAIKELSKKLEWRQDFQASGMHHENKRSEYFQLLNWVKKPAVLIKKQFLYIALAIILPVLFFVSLYLFATNMVVPDGYIYLACMIFIFIITYLVLRKIDALAEDIVNTSTNNLNSLKAYRVLINKIEYESFQSKKLNELKASFKKGKYSAYHEINKLCSLLEFSHQRKIKNNSLNGNYFYTLLNSLFLIDIYLILGTEKWKIKNRDTLKLWAEAVSEFEVLNSFAGFYYSNPTYTFPEMVDQNNFVEFESLGHPLIHVEKRVCNNFQSTKTGDVMLVTGSNMGGKSTFLRTVGVNLVLALAGAPCCAANGKVSNLKLFTSMRTQDNLKEGVSSFYAELERIEKMLELINNNNNVFFLLDEMFKGTNSKDRHKGGFSLINQITKLKTSGIIATHDIELAKLSENKTLVSNYSFNSVLKGETMYFSYKLEPGICNDFNASELMKRSGINIVNNLEE